MDVIQKITAAHGAIREQEDFMKKLLAAIDNASFFWDNALQVSEFFAKEVSGHFAMEEQVLFPILKKRLPSETSALLAELAKDHALVREQLKEFDTIVRQHTRYPSRSTREYLVKVCRGILDIVLPHAEKEDRELFPLIIRHFGSADYQELEERLSNMK